MDNEQLKRIADALEEILRLVKKDMEPRTKKEKENGQINVESSLQKKVMHV
jgi:hypothetical protein